MKTKIQFFKSNIILIFFLNLMYIPLIILISFDITKTIQGKIFISVIMYIISIQSTLNSWYNDYRFDLLEKEIKNKQL